MTPVERADAARNLDLIRFCDLCICIAGLFFLGPLLLGLALAVKVTSAGPIFYKARRIGRGGKEFALYKFRSMYIDADRRGPAITVHNDPRVTPVGRFLRRYKLDELPQIINILRGEMSIVGPRPEAPQYVKLYTAEQRQVLAFRPGLTSAASLHYSHEEALLTGPNWETIYKEQILPHKLALDLNYMRHYTVQSYFSLLFATFFAVFGRQQLLRAIAQLRNRHVLALDCLLLLFTPLIALLLHADATGQSGLTRGLILYTGVALAIKLVIFYQFKLYNRYWRYADIYDLVMIIGAVSLASCCLLFLFAGFHAFWQRFDLALPRAVTMLDCMLTGLVVLGVRFSQRFLYDWGRQHQIIDGNCRVLIVGAGVAGTLVLREIRANHELDMVAVAFVDDDPAKIGTRLQGLLVAGACDQIVPLASQYAVDRIIIAMPSASQARLQQIQQLCNATDAQSYSLPGMYELIGGYKTISPLPQVDVNRLLNREHIVTDQTEVFRSMQGKTVLVTGAGGSIGGELCRQIALCQPANLLLLGHGENSIFEIGLELRIAFPNLVLTQIVVDVRNEKRIRQVFEQYRPQLVFHAAAHKHVPLMQGLVEEAITNNVLGTRNVLQAAETYGAERFVLISTDKAINPTSVMGASKRIAELLVQAAARRSGRAYMAVRFGNVLGSRGSVIPIFQRQIAAGGPVTITHPEMTRYFMTIPEAVQLVLQASSLGRGGEIFMLDMGQPVRILELAKGLIQMAGPKEAQAIKIVFSGMRPGEKLHEELFHATEEYKRTTHEKIFMVTETAPGSDAAIAATVDQLIEAAQQLKTAEVIRQLTQLVPGCQLSEYQPVAGVHEEPVTKQTIEETDMQRRFTPAQTPIWAR